MEDGRPGVFQLDSVSHGGGGPEPHFYSLDMTDAETQWCELSFVWCRGAEATKKGFEKMVRRIPFDVRKIHPDGGGEFINDLFLKHIAKAMPDAKIMRSRPGRPNDNCRVEQKNGSILRGFLKDWRLGDETVQRDLDWIAEHLALYVNLFVPTKRLLSKTAVEGKGVKYQYRYDVPRTPLERLREVDPGNPNLAQLDKTYSMTNSVSLLALIQRKIASVARRSSCQGSSSESPPDETASKATSVSSHLTNGVVSRYGVLLN